MSLNRRRALAALAGGAAAGCNRNQKRIIGVIPQGKTHLFWQTIHAGAVAASQELGVEVEWNAPATETDYNGQLQIIDAMINKRVNAIALAPIDRTAMVSAVERSVREKIPVVIFDSGIESEVYSAWVATDNYAAGALAAARMGELTAGKGKVAIVAVRPGVASSVAREAGFEEKIKKEFPGIEIVDKRYGLADFAKSLAIAENMLTAHPDLAAFFASNESSTVGALRALKGRGSKVKLVGFDWSPDFAEDLKSGVLDSVIAQDPFRIGYESVRLAIAAVEGRLETKVHRLPPRLVRKEDLDKPDVQKLLTPDLKRYLG